MAPNMKFWDDWVDVEDMEAMWNHPEVRHEWLRAGEERGMKVHMSRNFDGKPYVTHTEMKVSFLFILVIFHMDLFRDYKGFRDMEKSTHPNLSWLLCLEAAKYII